MWRPENWEEITDAIEPEHCGKMETEYAHFMDGVEAGADAMLEALKNRGEFTEFPPSLGEPALKGYHVFIPDN